MKKSTLVTGLIAAAFTAGLIFAYSYVAGKGWKESQK